MEKKKALVLAAVALCIVLALGALAFVFGKDGEPIAKVEFSREITVENGAASPAAFTHEVIVPEDGGYTLKMDWTCAPGLLTGARLIGPDGAVPFAVTGECLNTESESLRLKAGKYSLEFSCLTSAEAFDAFVEANIVPLRGEADEAAIVRDWAGQPFDTRSYAFEPNGIWHNTYAYEVEESHAFHAGKGLGVLVGAVFGLILAVFILIFTKKDRALHAKYDERQQLARGNGYKLGFWTAVGYFAAMILLDLLEIRIPADTSIVAFTGMVLSAFVFTAYCILTDAYFALNENRKSLCVTMVLLGLCNIGFGVMSLISGEAIVDGVLTFRAINLICGIFLAAIGAVLFIRKIKAGREEGAAGGEDAEA